MLELTDAAKEHDTFQESTYTVFWESLEIRLARRRGVS